MSLRHATSDIYGHLCKWLHESIAKLRLHIDAMVIDFNWPTLHACCMMLNDMGVTLYVRLCWDIVKGRLTAARIAQVTLVTLGRSHVVKDIVGWKCLRTTNQQIKRTWKVALCQLINVSTLAEFDHVLDMIIGLLCSPSAEDAATHRMALQDRLSSCDGFQLDEVRIYAINVISISTL